jgi:molybdate transport system substrate-binding protein
MSRGAQALVVVLLLAVVAMGLLLIGRQQGEKGGRVLVYAPCGLQGPVQMVVTAYRQHHPQEPLEVVYDNANVLVRRVVKQGERPDVFISPGEVEIGQVARANLLDDRSVQDFGTLEMVLIAPAQRKTVHRVEDLASPEIKAVALGDPKFNSVGYYGEQVLRARKVWEAVQPKLILREFPLEAFNLVAQDKVAAGLAYLTCPLDTAPEKASKQSVRIVERIPRDSYGPIRLQLGLLKTSKQQAAARAFIDFMLSAEAQQVMASNGVTPMEARQ